MGNIKLSYLLPFFLIGALLISVATIWFSMELKEALNKVAQAQTLRFKSIILADELRESSDDLTRFCRMYVQTGDEKFKSYYHQVLAIRNGEAPIPPIPDGYEGVYWDLVIGGNDSILNMKKGKPISIQDRMVELGFTKKEFNLLKEAQKRSDSLTILENMAFNLAQDHFRDNTGSNAAVGSQNQKLAQELLYNKDYLRVKANIMKPIGDFQKEVKFFFCKS